MKPNFSGINEKILDRFPQGICIFGADKRIQYINPVLRKELGDLGTLACHEYFCCKAGECTACRFDDVVDGEPVFWKWRSPSSQRDYECVGIPLENDDGSVSKLEFFYNVTEINRTKVELQHNLDIQMVMFELMHLSIEDAPLDDLLGRALDLILSIRWLSFESRGAIFLLGEKESKLVMHAYRGLDTPVLQACKQVPLGRCLCGLAAQSGEMIFTDRLDERHVILYDGIQPHGHYCMPIKSGPDVLGVLNIYVKDGHIPQENEKQFLAAAANGLLGIIVRKRSEKERGRLQEQLFQAQKMDSVGRLAGGVAHDFNNLLNIILGYGELAATNLHPEDPLYLDIQQILEAGKRASDLTRQLLAFSRKQPLLMSVQNLNDPIRNMEKMLRRLIGEDITMEMHLAEDLGLVEVDPSQFEQVLLNLAVNSRDAMPQGGTLVIETNNIFLDAAFAAAHLGFKPGPHVTLSVRDTGCGMEKDVLVQIFEPFFTTKEKDKGTGLGLATVYGIVTQSGGQILVDSELGVGTTFQIFLPCTMERPTTSVNPRSANKQLGGGEHILVVEDDPILNKLISRMLTSRGYKVTVTSGGAEALEHVNERGLTPDLLLTDVVMPGISGAELALRLREQHPGLLVLFMSGYTDAFVASHGILDASSPFIQKPMSADALTRKVQELLRGSVP